MESFITTHHSSMSEIESKQSKVYQFILKQSEYLDQGNFDLIHDSDLELLFSLYDEIYFENRIRETLQEIPLYFQCSNRMTSAGAKTESHFQNRAGAKKIKYYMIKVSTKLLYNTFEEGDRPITVTGILCTDRLQAMQKLFEHELVHLVELLIWDQSSCTANRFQSIANRFFGHTQQTHDLITPRERARTEFSLHVGCRVTFDYQGEAFIGIINRITSRATVLVKSSTGQKYSDGQRYHKYYIPLECLEKL